jgi:hypothetical protein
VSYMVLYTGLDGSAAFGRCEELTEAVAEVERLRNEQSIDGAQIYRLEEVKFEIKPYFRVELPAAASAIDAPAPLTFATPSTTDAPTPEDAPWVSASASSVTDVPSMIIPPPPPPPPAPVAPMAYDVAPMARESVPQDDDAIVGGRRGLFGR